MSGGRSERRRARTPTVRDHARCRHEPGEPDRRLACRTTTLRKSRATLQPRLPGRGGHPGLALRGRVGWRGIRTCLAEDRPGQPLPGGDGQDLLPPLRGGLQQGSAGRVGRDQLGRAVPGRRGAPSWLDTPASRAGQREACAGRRRGSLGAECGLPPRPRRPPRDDLRGGGEAGWDDALRHPRLPPPA